jgi:hypothetical protein
MIRMSTDELQTRRDICRAEFLVALGQGLTRDQSAEALRYRAAAEGLSLHAAALAVLTPEPADEVLAAWSFRAAPSPSRDRLDVLASPAERRPTAPGEVSAPRRGRHRR